MRAPSGWSWYLGLVGSDEVLLQALVSSSNVSLPSQSQPQEAAVFDHYAPKIGPLQMGASLLLVALGLWAVILLAK
jgi:hypothetical protein